MSAVERLATELVEACRDLTESERVTFLATFAEAPPFTSERVSRLFDVLLRMVEETGDWEHGGGASEDDAPNGD